MSTPEVRNTVKQAHDHRPIIERIVGEQIENRTFNPTEDPEATTKLKELTIDWREQGKLIVMVFGTFDAPFHPDHQGFLLDCKTQGVAWQWAKENNESWEELPDDEKEVVIRSKLTDGAIRLIVSSDGDARIQASKSGKAEKGGSVRPLQSWPTRVHNLAHFALSLTPGAPSTRIVDAITVHDHIEHPGTPHAVPNDLVHYIAPDMWTLYHEAKKDIVAAQLDSRLNKVEIRVIDERGYGSIDPLTGEPYSTTALVNRARATAVTQ